MEGHIRQVRAFLLLLLLFNLLGCASSTPKSGFPNCSDSAASALTWFGKGLSEGGRAGGGLIGAVFGTGGSMIKDAGGKLKCVNWERSR